MAFLPSDFIPPVRVVHDRFIVRPITIHDVVKDYEAVMSSYDHLRSMFGEVWGWPNKKLTLEQNLIDLGWHQKEYQLKSSFDYAVMSTDEERLLGCVYVDPPEIEGYDAEVCLWVRQSELENGLDEVLYTFAKDWIAKNWPFNRVAYPGREIEWNA